MLFLFIPVLLLAQDISDYRIEDILEQMSIDEEGEERSLENYVEELSHITRNPFNLNAVTKEQLELLPFLSDDQIENLLYYQYVYGPMKTIYELQMVKDMDWETIQLLLPFVCVEEVKERNTFPTFQQLVNNGKSELASRLDIPLYKRAGYYNYPDSILQENPNRKYMGSPLYHSVRYGYHYKDRVYFGLTAEKDAGEPFFSGPNKKGYDYYSFYFLVKDIGNLKSLAIGNYRLNYGLGLVMNMDYSLGKTSTLSTIGYKSGGIKKHSSTDEYNYLRGIAASYQLRRFLLSLFYSHRPVDTIVENGLITSTKKDGLHRIPRDFERRNNSVNQLFGVNISFQKSNFRLGSTFVYNFFNRLFIPEVKPYSVFYRSGEGFYNLSVDYRYRWNRITVFGETAINESRGIATLNVFRLSPANGYQLVLLQRYYSKEYHSFYGRSFSENSDIRNERGVYMGLEATPVRYWKLFMYGDFFTFPWLKYGVDRSSSGFDGLLQANYSPKKNLTMFWRYRYKSKDKNFVIEEGNKIVSPFTQHRFRYQLNYQLLKRTSFRTTLDYTNVYAEGSSHSQGFMLTQAVAYRFANYPVLIELNYGIFDTDDYSSRLSIYEKGLLYSFSVPSFYGKGIRSAMNVRYDISPALMAIIKISQTKYFDRKEIGGGLEKIDSDQKSDIYLQLRYKF